MDNLISKISDIMTECGLDKDFHENVKIMLMSIIMHT